MKILLSYFIVLIVTVGACEDGDSIREHLKAGKSNNRIFVTTNKTSAPFYLIQTNLDLSGMVGKKLNRNLISMSRFDIVHQFVPSMEMVEGRPRPSSYGRLSGRYAVLVGQTLTLTSFVMHTSNEAETMDQVMLVHSESCTFEVTDRLRDECNKLHSQPED